MNLILRRSYPTRFSRCTFFFSLFLFLQFFTAGNFSLALSLPQYPAHPPPKKKRHHPFSFSGHHLVDAAGLCCGSGFDQILRSGTGPQGDASRARRCRYGRRSGGVEEQDQGDGGTGWLLRKLGLGRRRGVVAGEVKRRRRRKSGRRRKENTLFFFSHLCFSILLSTSSMRVRLLLFARAKELVGTGETELELADGALSWLRRKRWRDEIMRGHQANDDDDDDGSRGGNRRKNSTFSLSLSLSLSRPLQRTQAPPPMLSSRPSWLPTRACASSKVGFIVCVFLACDNAKERRERVKRKERKPAITQRKEERE